MPIKNLYSVYFYHTLFIAGVIVFFIGFFTISHNVDSFSDRLPPVKIDNQRLNNEYKSYATKFILMVVDALRYDFVTFKNMPFVSKKVEDDGNCRLKMKVKVPTVTLPRIKTLVTGTISNFIDVILNFGHIALTQDSFIHQMTQRSDKIVYYGDTTWTSLFPDKFRRFETNQDALFLNDFDEGDQNVRKNIEKEMLHEWDHLIFHFLGLDHIGHVEGDSSPKILLKLKEMDDVVRFVDSWITKFDRNFSEPTIFFVTADHGMRLSGGHGGATIEETTIPLIIINCKCKNTNTIFNQIDTAPTISVLLGLPIPSNSIGCIIPEAIEIMSLEDQLYALYYNTNHLINKAKQKFGREFITTKDYYQLYTLGKEAHKAFSNSSTVDDPKIYSKCKHYYGQSSKIISEILEASLARFDFYLINLGLCLSTIASIQLILIGFISMKVSSISSTVCKDCGISLLLGAFSFLFLNKSIFFSFVENPISILKAILSSLFCYMLLNLLRSIKNSQSIRQIPVPVLIVVVVAFHMLSYLSSSFIEEEHQTWYYIVTSYLILLFAIDSFSIITSDKKFVFKSNLVKFLIERQYNKFFENLKIALSKMKLWILILILHIFARRLNQTGDKWLHLKDFGDWLTSANNKNPLNCLIVAGCLLIAFTTQRITKNKYLSDICKIIALASIYIYRTVSEDVNFFGISFSAFKRNSLVLFCICFCALVVFSYGPITYKLLFGRLITKVEVKNLLGTNCLLITLISALVHRPQNVILIPICTLTLQQIYNKCDRLFEVNSRIIVKTVSTIWIGKMFYFYQGNSNNLATVDVTPGFILTDKSNLIVITLLLTINTFSFPLCCLGMLIYNIYNEWDLIQVKNAYQTSITLYTIFITIPVTFYLYILVGHRHHLFIYSVFAPKFLFECINVCLWNVLLFSSILLEKCLL